jgi:ribosomal-protein-alanine N-acetyltransferase
MKKGNTPEIENLVIRPMRRSDVTAVALAETQIFPDPWPESAFFEELNRDNRGVLIAEWDGAITGYAVYIITYGEAQLANIAVVPQFRRKSIAKVLINHILKIAKEADCEYIFLDVRPSNKAAINLYQKFGFYELYCRPNYYRSPVEDGLVMVKNLRENED